MTSVNHVLIPTRGYWFQTNPLEHEWDGNHDNCADLYVFFTIGKKVAAQLQILWLRKTEIQDRV